MSSSSLLLMRPKPFEDELLTSWIVRIAWHNVEKLESMTSKFWGTRSQIWTRDLDRMADPRVYTLLAEKSGVACYRLWEATLAAYEGTLYEKHCYKGATRWIMPTGGRKRDRFLFGLQCCPLCLQTDEQTYYRRNWRLACIATCLKHQVVLIDRCDCCGSSISFHQSDFGRFDYFDALRMTYCKNCGRDYRNIQTTSISCEQWGELGAEFQTLVEAALRFGWVELNARTQVPAILFFEGVRHLARALASNEHCCALRMTLARALGLPYQATRFFHGQLIERLPIEERLNLFGMIGWLLQEWPDRFIAISKEAKIASSYLQSYRELLPYWLAMPIKWHLDRTWYRPNAAEIQSVINFLDRRGLPVNRNSVRKWLGRWYVSRQKKEKLISLDSAVPLSNRCH